MQALPLEETAAAEATLELTLLSLDGHHFPRSSFLLLAKQNPSLAAWVDDPSHKRSLAAAARNCVLHLPLSSRHLRNPGSLLTVQILSPRSAFKPFRNSSAGASASVCLSALPISGGPVTLHLRRPSGRVAAAVRFSVRILWSLVPDPVLNLSDSGSFREEESGFRLEPSAPPLPESEMQRDDKMREGIPAWRNFLLGALSGAAAVILCIQPLLISEGFYL